MTQHKHLRGTMSLKRFLSVLAAVSLLAMMVGTAGCGNTINSAEPNTNILSDGKSESSAHLISTSDQLHAVRDDLSAHYRLVNDIDLVDWGNWEPIGTYNNPFKGTFDGEGFVIRNMKIEINSDDDKPVYAGLFGCLDRATLKNTGIENSTVNVKSSNMGRAYAGGITGYANYSSSVLNCYFTGEVRATAIGITSNPASYAGGIAGAIASSAVVSNCYNLGNVNAVSDDGTSATAGGIAGDSSASTISGCYNTGAVNAVAKNDSDRDARAGGIVGYSTNYMSYTGSTVSDCFNWGEVSAECSGTAFVGGIVGYSGSFSTIDNCYNIGNTRTAGSSTAYVGGIVGDFSFEELSNCYYLTNVAGRIGAVLTNVQALTEEQMRQQSSFVGFDFSDVWVIDSANNSGYPYLAHTALGNAMPKTIQLPKDISPTGDNFFAGGNGSHGSPYLISTPAQLDAIRNNLRANHSYKLINDIDLAEWGEWEPIGIDYMEYFGGNFDGDGYVIKNMTVNRNIRVNEDVLAGLFGYAVGATIKNIGLINSTVRAIADTSGESAFAGGIAGNVESTTIINCYNKGTVSATSVDAYTNVGGLVGGADESSKISNSYNSGNVSAKSRFAQAGGIAGGTSATINNCYNTGDVTATGDASNWNTNLNNSRAGGITGSTSSATISNCYNTGAVHAVSSLDARLGGIAGERRSSEEVNINNCYYLNISAKADGGGIGLTEDQMRQQASFIGFDFAGVWAIDSSTNNGYPYLRDMQP